MKAATFADVDEMLVKLLAGTLRGKSEPKPTLSEWLLEDAKHMRGRADQIEHLAVALKDVKIDDEATSTLFSIISAKKVVNASAD